MSRVVTVTTGTRADYGSVRPILNEIQRSDKLDLRLLVTGMHLSQKFGMTINYIKSDGFEISACIPLLPENDTNYDMAVALGKGVVSFADAFNKIKPDINLISGDRDEALASALAAYHMNIPNAHVHGGDRSRGGIDEYTRHAITKISNIHFAASEKSYKRIIKMGEHPDYVFNTGSPGIDEISQGRITPKTTLETKYGKIDNILLFVQHPITTQSQNSKDEIRQALCAIEETQMKTVAIAPNSDAGSDVIVKYLKEFAAKHSFFKVYPTLPREDYLGLLKHGGMLVGNSSSGPIEGGYFDTKVINIGIRQEGRESGGNVINVRPAAKEIVDAIKTPIVYGKKKPYGIGNASANIVRHLERVKLDENLIKKQIYY